jgi:hypothetical protein
MLDPCRSWLAVQRGKWRRWPTLDPLTREYEGERMARGVMIGLVLAALAWAAVALLWGRL